MKLVGISALIGLASAAPSQQAASASHATVLSDTPYWSYHADYVSLDYYNEVWRSTVTLEEVPDSGTNAWTICTGLAMGTEAFCPISAEHAMRVYSDVVVRHFMPQSAAAGVLDESEVSNIPSGIMTGYRTKDWAGSTWTGSVPETIDNADAVAGHGQGGANDVYGCGPSFGGAESWLGSIHTPTIEFMDATASAPNHCTELGSHGGYGDSFADFKLKNVDCAKTSYVLCNNPFAPMGSSHGGYAVTEVQLNSTNVDIMKAAFDIMNDPANQVVEEPEEEDNTTTDTGAGNTGGNSTTTEESSGSGSMGLIIGGVVIVVAVVLFFVLGKKD